MVRSEGSLLVCLRCPDRMTLGDARSECRIPMAGRRMDAVP
ncbi:MAG: hypothetical protein ACK41F_07805 [Fimbriimonadaceae bacterium]